MQTNIFLTIRSGRLSRTEIERILRIHATPVRSPVKRLLRSHGSAALAAVNSHWEVELRTRSRDIGREVCKLLESLPSDFSKRLAKLSRPEVCLSVAVVSPAKDAMCSMSKQCVDKLSAFGAEINFIVFSKDAVSSWTK